MTDMVQVIQASLDARIKPDKRDAAAAALALHYGALIDRPATDVKIRRAWRVLVNALDGVAMTDDLQSALDLIRDTLSEHTVAKEFGPRLLTTLDALGLTSKARGVTPEVNPNANGRPNPIDELKKRREERAREAF